MSAGVSTTLDQKPSASSAAAFKGLAVSAGSVTPPGLGGWLEGQQNLDFNSPVSATGQEHRHEEQAAFSSSRIVTKPDVGSGAGGGNCNVRVRVWMTQDKELAGIKGKIQTKGNS